MSIPIDDAEAQFALSSIEERRRQVIAEIDVPRWYWLALAAGWVALGVIADFRTDVGGHRGHAGVRGGPCLHCPATCSRVVERLHS